VWRPVAAGHVTNLLGLHGWSPALTTSNNGSGSATANSYQHKTGSSKVATPTTVQDGMVTNCDEFYKVLRVDGCWAIADFNKVQESPDDSYSWNPVVGTSCARLQADMYVRIGLAASLTTIPAPATTTTAAGAVMPTPIQDAMTAS
ncbi:LysM domain-containing protein-like protein 7, partial [Colletotrichum chlorophyti]